jgi:sulfate transport system substrate-binding protein
MIESIPTMSWLDHINLRAVSAASLSIYRKRSAELLLGLICLTGLCLFFQHRNRPNDTLLNVSFDAARPTMARLDQAWSETTKMQVRSAHAGSLQQTEALANGLRADTICVSSASELDRLSQGTDGLVSPNWRERFPEMSSPFSSSIVFIIKPGVEETVQTWQDLLHSKLRLAIPDPRISGAGQYAYLALVYSIQKNNEPSAFQLTTALQQLQLLPYAAKRSTSVFLQSDQYDLLLTWESEAHRIMQQPKNQNLRIVHPNYSLKIEPVVAIVESQVDQRGTRHAAESYLNFYFSPQGQAIIEQSGFRRRLFTKQIAAEVPAQILYTVESLFGTWENAYELHLGPDSSLTRLLEYRSARKGGSE